jgi:predicted O-methyltransferase YrrM
MGTLRELFDKYGCDKGTKKHKYDRCYEPYMADRRDDQLNILEIGCFRGESTWAWLEYFPHATIYTIDIFERHTPNEIDVLKEERVKWLKADSMNASLPMKMRKEWGDVEFDFIIDDGAHWPQANRLTFENCMPFLKQDGAYFIEDVWMLDRMKSHPWVEGRPQLYSMPEHVRFMTTIEQFDVKHYDYRTTTVAGSGAYPDGYILRVKYGAE